MEKTKLNIRDWAHKVFVRKKYKDFLFRRVFENKRDLLDLYNALNDTHYDNPNDLEITTLEDVIYLSMKNDISFIISSTLNLYEHQSTINPNMAIRGLLYFARQYEGYIKVNDLDIYGKKLVLLPAPRYIIFYNGREEMPDEQIIKLSDSFGPKSKEEPALECKARVLNINLGHNEKIMNACKRLHDYSYFVKEVNSNLDNGQELKKAIDKAMISCIEKNILRDVLLKHRAEVFHMLLTEYNERRYRRTLREEGREEGLKEAREDNLKDFIMILRPLLNDDFDVVCNEIRKSDAYKNYSDEDIRKYWK